MTHPTKGKHSNLNSIQFLGAKKECQRREKGKEKNKDSRDTSLQIKDSNIYSIQCNSKTGLSSKDFCVSYFKGKKCRSEEERRVWAIGNASCTNHPHHSIYDNFFFWNHILISNPLVKFNNFFG